MDHATANGQRVRIAVVGDHDPSLSTHRAIDEVLERLAPVLDASWWPTERARELWDGSRDGVWLAPGTPYRDDGAVLDLIGHCRENDVPFLGTCGGFQYAAVELARSAGADAAHAELDPEHPQPLVEPLACSLVGEVRTVTPVDDSLLAVILGTAPFEGYHRCSYGLSRGAEEILGAAGVRVAARAPDAGAEALELEDHPFFVATLFQPQVQLAGGTALSPLIVAFVEAATAARAR